MIDYIDGNIVVCTNNQVIYIPLKAFGLSEDRIEDDRGANRGVGRKDYQAII
jgi:hypothetical protein